jgi:beta-glucosidase
LKTFDGEVGVTFKAFIDPPTNPDRRPVQTLTVEDTYMYLSDYSHPAIATDLWWAEVDGYFAPEESGPFEFGLTVFGTGKLFVDGKLVVDNETKQRSGGSFFNVGTVEETGIVDLVAGQTYKIGVVWASGVTSKLADADGVVSFGGGGIRIGGAKVINPDDEVTKAVELAKSVDQVVLCVGLNSDLEQEGHDRRHMDLPGHTDCLVHAVAAANPRTIVVVQSGTPVSMPWASDVSAIVQAWYGGNETGNAIADILYGDVNPSGKLPLSFPVRLEDNPTFFNFRSERGRVLYGEDVYIGYRFYETTKKQVLWPFGWGLSYTSFQISGLRVTQSSVDPTSKLTISVDVANTGTTDGAEVVQVYVSQRQPSIRRPEKELKGFKKVFVPSDTSQNVEIEIERKYATSFWDEERQQWVEESGVYDILVGTSSVEISARETFEVERTTWWSGL